MAGEDGVDRAGLDRVEVLVRLVRHWPARPSQGRLVAPLAVGLGRAPVDVVAAFRVHPAHVDALDRAGLRALEASLALQRPVLVVEQLEAAAELVRDVEAHLGVPDRRLRLEEPPERQAHALDEADTGEPDHRRGLTSDGPRRSPARGRTG